jgi:hypothetical protein
MTKLRKEKSKDAENSRAIVRVGITKIGNMMKKYLMLLILSFVGLVYCGCTTTNEYTAIAKSELTKQMLENSARLPVITPGIEDNIVYGTEKDNPSITYEYVSNSLISENQNNKSGNNINSTEYCIVTYSGQKEIAVDVTSTKYRYRVRKCQDVSIGIDKLKVEESSPTKTYWALTGGLTGVLLIILLAAQ